jgi:hypothetical protein
MALYFGKDAEACNDERENYQSRFGGVDRGKRLIRYGSKYNHRPSHLGYGQLRRSE